MNRRKFLFSPIAIASLTLLAGVETDKRSKSFFRKTLSREVNVGLESTYFVEAGKVYVLPVNARHGRKFRFVVDRNSLMNPARITHPTYTIAGDKDSLVLDTLAIFSIQYNNITNNLELV